MTSKAELPPVPPPSSSLLPIYFTVKVIFTKFMINTLLWTLIIIFGSLPLFCALILRYTVDWCAKIFRLDLIAATANDCSMVREAPTVMPISNGGLILRIDGKIHCEEFRTHFTNLFLKEKEECYRNFYCDLEIFGGFLYKRVTTKEINIQHHINEFIFDSKGNKNLKESISVFFQKKFVVGYPLWEILLFQCDCETIVCIKISHALADGYSLVHILDKLTGNTSPTYFKNDVEYTTTERVFKFLTLPCTGVAFLMRDVWSADCFPPMQTLDKIEMMPMTWATVDLEPIKKLRRKLNVHFPAIIYSLQVGALRKLMLEKMRAEDLMEFTFLTSSLPVPGHPRNSLTNHWTGGRFKIPFKTADAKERLLQTNKYFEKVTKEEAPYLIWKYITPLFWLFPARLAFILSFINVGIFRYRSSISCIPQAKEKYFLLGKHIKHIYHTPIMKDSFPQAALLGCSSSQHQQIDLTLFGHPDLVSTQSDMERVMHSYFQEELQSLLRSANIADNVHWLE